MTSNIRTVGVVGTGVIGSSWTALFLARGLRVLVSDPGIDAEKKLAADLKEYWPALEAIGLAPGASLSNYEFVGPTLKYRYQEVDFIQENAPERADLKTNLVGEIDAGARPDVVIASSSSGLPSSKFVGECKKNPGRVLIGHPFNPPHLLPLVEVVPHPGTDAASVQAALEFYRSVGKYAVHVKQEVPGHIANRLQAALTVEAYSLVARGVLSAEDLDACVTTSLGPRWALTGPIMSQAFGGGGGPEGLRHLIQHIGPGMRVWLEDMNAHPFDFGEKSIDTLVEGVRESFDHHSAKHVEEQKDKVLIQLLKLKATAPDII
ncbi:hypothetical protein AMS68_002196 [Peltaster fructicola]|uniref:3-hydroxyacyl-CoA dehydrogenase NAD binding domain-containing protein n=1 Tax=Peltaster fructicola TaxID=286661 RepID=A0A6H0XPY2_9PEZI|nr:hypothetical protein AMS68_002196 [Peltaster fructicola]